MEDRITVEEEQSGGRLDAFLAERVPEISRSHWKTLIQSGQVMLNGAASKPNHKLKSGDVIDWTVPEETPGEVMPEDIPLNILYEDDVLLVLNKPPGLVVHPAAGNETGTLVNALMFHDPVFGTLERAGIVHRLDKDTSGVMVVAKSDQAADELRRQFKARETQKEYLTLVWGAPLPEGRIETLMGRHPMHRKKMAVLTQDGRKAVSNYETLERFDEVSLVRVAIETGRTHQIRVHLAHIGHPIVGDTIYGRSRRHTLPEKPERQMLHAARLVFTHPETGKKLSFEAPLFEDISRLLEHLRGG